MFFLHFFRRLIIIIIIVTLSQNAYIIVFSPVTVPTNASVTTTSPDRLQFILIEKIHSSAIASDVKVFFQIPSLFEPNLRQIASGVVSKQHLPAGFQDSMNVPHRCGPLCRAQSGKDKDHEYDVDGCRRETRRERFIIIVYNSNVPDISLNDSLVVQRIRSDERDGLGREIAGVDLQGRISIVGEDRKSGVACSGTDFEDGARWRLGLGEMGQDGEFLMQPFAVFEEVGRIVLVE